MASLDVIEIGNRQCLNNWRQRRRRSVFQRVSCGNHALVASWSNGPDMCLGQQGFPGRKQFGLPPTHLLPGNPCFHSGLSVPTLPTTSWIRPHLNKEPDGPSLTMRNLMNFTNYGMVFPSRQTLRPLSTIRSVRNAADGLNKTPLGPFLHHSTHTSSIRSSLL